MGTIKRIDWGWRRIEISKGRGLSASIYHSESTWGFHLELPYLFSLYLPLMRAAEPPEEMWDSYGFSWQNGANWGFFRDLHLNWGNKCKIVHMPWAMEWYRTSYLLADQTWYHEITRGRKNHIGVFDRMRDREQLPLWKETHDYTYCLKNGKKQFRKATIKVEEREWRRRWLMWLPLFRQVRRSIDIAFDDEVGERSGSWKGGVLGTGCELLPTETPWECLQRFERTIKL